MIEKIGALETVDNGSGAKVKPKTDVVIQSVTVGDVGATPTTAPSATASAEPSAPASATPTAAAKS